MSLVSVVVPVYCNARSLPDLWDRLRGIAGQAAPDSFEFVFVDDGSTDDSFQVLQHLAQADPSVTVIKLSRNFGSNPALLAGLAHARGDVVATLAADLQDPPETLLEMLALWRGGRRVVLAARSSRDEPWITTVFSDLFYLLFRRFALPTMPRRGFDFFLVDRSVCTVLNGLQESNAYLMGLVLWAGFDPAVVYFERKKRHGRYGHSMWTSAKKVKYFIDSFVAFSYVPLRAATLLGIILGCLGGLYAAVVIILRLTRGFPVEGWASLMVVFLIISGTNLFVMGILGEYVWRSLDETRRRPRFVIERVVDRKSTDVAAGG